MTALGIAAEPISHRWAISCAIHQRQHLCRCDPCHPSPLPDGEQWGYAKAFDGNFTRDFLGHACGEGFEFDVLTLSLSTSLQSGRYLSTNPFDFSAKVEHITRDFGGGAGGIWL